MGLFDFLKRKPQTDTPVPQEPVSDNAVVAAGTTQLSEHVRLHPDLEGQVWIGNGKYKNYTETASTTRRFEIDGLEYVMQFEGTQEPSLLFTNLPIKKPASLEGVERPPYFPTYSALTPEQRFIYLRLLNNPYDTAIDIGYVFILYYGLERHLLQGDFERAFHVILKLRDVHKNKSFQNYSANALILSAKMHERGELIIDFLKSLDKEWEYNFSDNLFLLCCYSFNIPLLPATIMRMAKTFEFSNTNYIKKYPDVFERCLRDVLVEDRNDDKVFLEKYFTKTELKKTKTQDIPVFANMSIRSKSVPVPLLSESFKLKKDMSIVLEKAHERTKAAIADSRKKGTLIEAAKPAPEKKAASKNEPVLDRADVAIKRHEFDRSKLEKAKEMYNQKIEEWYKQRDAFSKGETQIRPVSTVQDPILEKHFEYSELVRTTYAHRNPGFNRRVQRPHDGLEPRMVCEIPSTSSALR